MNVDVDKSIGQLQESLDNISDAIANRNRIRALQIKGVIGNLGILRQYLCRIAGQEEPKPLPSDNIKADIKWVDEYIGNEEVQQLCKSISVILQRHQQCKEGNVFSIENCLLIIG